MQVTNLLRAFKSINALTEALYEPVSCSTHVPVLLLSTKLSVPVKKIQLNVMQKSSSVLPLWPLYFIVFYPDRVIMAAVSEAFWEMQSFANDRRTAKRREQHWEHATIVTRMSYLLSLTHTFPFFSFPSFSLSDFVPFIFQPHSAPLSPFLAFLANQGSKKGWSDYCRTAEEDSEQLESPRFSQQEWPSTCLKKWTRQMKTTRDLSVGLC